MTAPGVPGRALHGRLQITKGLSGKSDFTISPPPEQTPAGGDFCFRLLVLQPLFVDMDAAPGSRMRRPLQQGKDGRVNAAMISAMIPGMISAMTPAMMAHAVMPDRLGSAFHPDVLFAEAVADAEIEAAARIPVFAPAAEGRRVRGVPVPAVFLEGVVAHDAQVELLLEELLFDAHVIIVVAFRFAAEPRIPRRIILTQHKPRLLPECEVEVEVLAERELVGVDVHGVEIVLPSPSEKEYDDMLLFDRNVLSAKVMLHFAA